MKKKSNLPVEFYIDPDHTYDDHKVNILKECLVEWTKSENIKFYPYKLNEFTYNIECVETGEGKEIIVFHCHTTYDWIGRHGLYDDLAGLISFFE